MMSTKLKKGKIVSVTSVGAGQWRLQYSDTAKTVKSSQKSKDVIAEIKVKFGGALARLADR